MTKVDLARDWVRSRAISVLVYYTTQLSLFNCSASASGAAAKRTNTASGSSLKYSLSHEPGYKASS